MKFRKLSKVLTRLAWAGLPGLGLGLLTLAIGCGDDGSAGAGGGAGGSASTTGGASSCVTRVVLKADAMCFDTCGNTYSGPTYTFCTDACAGPDAPCPGGTACRLNVVDQYDVCLPTCDDGVCPEHMLCDTNARCEPE